MKKIVAALSLFTAWGLAVAQDEPVLQGRSGAGSGANSVIDTIRDSPKDPESVGKLMAVFVSGMAVSYEHCGFSDERIARMKKKTDRILELTYGTLPLAQRVSFARGYFLAGDTLVEYLNGLPESNSTSMCARLASEEVATHKYLDEQLVGYEKLVKEGAMAPADIYEGRIPVEPLSAQPAVQPAAK